LSQVLPTRVEARWSLDLTLAGEVAEISFRRPRIAQSPPVPPPERFALRG
jgi:hypothetical protein